MSATSANKLDSLDALRITRRPEREHRTGRARGFIPISLALIVALAGAGYAVYLRALERPLAVETVVVTSRQVGLAGILLTGSGSVVTRHKYITVGTKILGQIVEEPIEEGQRVKKGDLLARIDDRDYQAQLRQAIADRDLALANVRLSSAKADRERELYNHHVVSRDE